MMIKYYSGFRGVAQFGRALRSGRRGRGFKSRHLDQHQSSQIRGFSVCGLFSFLLILPLREIFREILGRLTIFANYVNSVDAAFSASTLHLLSVFFVRYACPLRNGHQAISCVLLSLPFKIFVSTFAASASASARL